MNESELRYQLVEGRDVLELIPGVAQLHVDVFRDYPYLYDRSAEFEQRLMEILYNNTPSCLFALVYDGDRLVGATTARSMSNNLIADGVQQLFASQGIDPSTVLYLSDSVLLSAYRGRGIGVWFFAVREQFAIEGGFDLTAFCAVERPPDHPRRPADYQALDQFWRNRGYAPKPGLEVSFAWTDIGEQEASEHPMQYWLKSVPPKGAQPPLEEATG